MSTEFLVRMKMFRMSDWIDDHFDELERRVPARTRFLLEDTLDDIYIEDEMEIHHFMCRIFDPDLTPEGVTDLFRELNDRRAPVRDQYAPRQKDLRDWIRSFCFC